jgi:hypothetical protein
MLKRMCRRTTRNPEFESTVDSKIIKSHLGGGKYLSRIAPSIEQVTNDIHDLLQTKKAGHTIENYTETNETDFVVELIFAIRGDDFETLKKSLAGQYKIDIFIKDPAKPWNSITDIESVQDHKEVDSFYKNFTVRKSY